MSMPCEDCEFWKDKIKEKDAKIAELEKRVGELEEALKYIRDLDPTEINILNYEYEDVCLLNESSRQAQWMVEKALTESKSEEEGK